MARVFSNLPALLVVNGNRERIGNLNNFRVNKSVDIAITLIVSLGWKVLGEKPRRRPWMSLPVVALVDTAVPALLEQQ